MVWILIMFLNKIVLDNMVNSKRGLYLNRMFHMFTTTKLESCLRKKAFRELPNYDLGKNIITRMIPVRF
jgi:hypothetical protein